MTISCAGLGLLANVGIEILELARGGGEIGWHEPVILEGTSHAAIVLLFPLVLWFNHRNTIRGHKSRRTVLAHALFRVAFSLAHMTLMYWARVGLFATTPGLGWYRWDSWPAQFAYEYLKDFRAYMLIIVIVYLLQTDARVPVSRRFRQELRERLA